MPSHKNQPKKISPDMVDFKLTHPRWFKCFDKSHGGTAFAFCRKLDDGLVAIIDRVTVQAKKFSPENAKRYYRLSEVLPLNEQLGVEAWYQELLAKAGK
jgi:hypothetical protein